MKKSLYNIQNEHMELIHQIELAEGEITEEIGEQLAINESELQGKSIAYLSVIRHSESNNELIKDEIKRLQGLVKRNDTLVSRLKDNLLTAVNLFGAFEVDFTKFGTRKSSSVVVEDINSLPARYKTTKVVESADKKAIKDDLKRGVTIKGCSIQDNHSLKIN